MATLKPSALKTSIMFATGAVFSQSAFAQEAETTSKKVADLETIVVTASGYEQQLAQAPASISVVNQEQIQRSNASNIAELLTEIPGVDVRNGVGKTSNLNIGIRGMGSAYTLILIDGRRQTTSSGVTPNGFGETATGFLPPPSAIERIEVIRGPMATRYGSDAMGGVINIITKKNTDTWSGNLTLSGNVMEHGAEADSAKASFLINGPIISDRLGVQLRGSYLDRQAAERIDPNSTSRDPRPSEADLYDVGAKIDLRINDENTVWVDGFSSSQLYQNDQNRLGTMDTATSKRGYKDELEFNRNQVSIGHDGHYGFGSWSTYVSQNITETKGRTIPDKTFPANQYAGSDRILENTDILADSHLVLPLSNHQLTLGAEYRSEKAKDYLAGIGAEFKSTSISAYAEDAWSVTDNLIFTLGGRYEDHEQSGGNFSPRGYLVWSATPALTLKGGVSTGYKTPSAIDLHDGIVSVSGQGTSFDIGSPDLKPEKSTNYEIGFNYEHEKFNLTSTIFYTQFKDKIVDGPDTPNCSYEANPNVAGCISYGDHITSMESFSQKINAGRAKSQGAEISLDYDILPEWNLRTAYTYTKSEITKGEEEGQYLNNVPRNALNTTSTWHINPDVDLWLQHEYKSDRVRSTSSFTPGTDDYLANEAAGNKLKGYNVFNLGASYQAHPNVRVTGSINNLLDKDFTDYTNYQRLDGTTGTVYDYLSVGRSVEGTYIPGRNYWLSLSYDF